MRKLILASSLLVLGGCTALQSTQPQETIYSLRPAAPSEEVATGTARILEISKPFVPPGLDRDRIALYLNDGQKLDYYAAAKWSATLDDVIQNFTRRTASTVLPYVVAITPDQSIDANYKLQVKVNEFQPIYGADLMENPRLVASVEFTLISMPRESIITSFTLSKQGTASDNRLDVITAGLEKMLQEIEREAFLKMDAQIRAVAK